MIFTVTLAYQGKQYTYQEEITSSEQQKADNWADEVLAEYLYEEGNYACDCNRSAFIAEHCDEDFPDLPCGNEITLVELSPRPVAPKPTIYRQQSSGLYIPVTV